MVIRLRSVDRLMRLMAGLASWWACRVNNTPRLAAGQAANSRLTDRPMPCTPKAVIK